MPAALLDPPPRAMPPAPPRGAVPPGDPSGRLALHGVDWETYLTLCGDSENDGLRFTYDGTAVSGVLEIEMPPEFRHEQVSRLLYQLIAAFLTARGIDWEPAGAVHVRRPGRRGGMPDESFYLAPGAIAAARTTSDAGGGGEPVPPAAPDLVLEVVFGNPLSERKRAAFAEAGVREVWVWEDGALTVLTLADAPDPVDRTFAEARESALLAGFPLLTAAELLARRAELGAPALLKEFTAALAGSAPPEA